MPPAEQADQAGEAGQADQLMDAAVTLAAGGRGWVEPNPMVGALIVRGSSIIGRGFHERFGGPHAEVAALEDCCRRGRDPAGATLVVTLEPCCHQGKTPPCTDAIIAAGIGRVVVAMADPFERVAGRGIEKLRAAGIEVEIGPGETAARRLNEPYLKRLTTGLPWVIAKWAQTLDGRIAAASGDSKWISCQRSRHRVHEWRARVDAVMVGVGTVIADDPLLTARGVEIRRPGKRIVIDPNGRMPGDRRLADEIDPPVVVAADPLEALRRLGEGGATNVLVEGGAKLIGSMLTAGLIDQVLCFVAPKIAGDPDALAAVRGEELRSIADAQRLELREVERIDDDVLLDYRVLKTSGTP